MVLNTKGELVHKGRQDAQLKLIELGRHSKVIKQQMLLAEENAQLPQVLRDLSFDGYPHIDIVDIFVKLKKVSIGSRRHPDKTMLRLTQVAGGTKGSRCLPCFRVTRLEEIIKLLETKADEDTDPLFKFTGSSPRNPKPSEFLGRMKSNMMFQMVFGMENDEAGRNIGWHDGNKEEYSDENVYLLGHPFLDVNDPAKVALIRKNKNDNPAWSFENLPRP